MQVTNKNRVVILSTADFDSPVWTNKQHLAKGLAANNEVIYIESLGLREPTLSAVDIARMFRKVTALMKRGVRGGQSESQVSDAITVVSPIIVPFHKYSIIRSLNKKLLKHQLANIMKDSERSTLWTFSPLTYGIEKSFGHVVYHSVDLMHTVPKIPGKLLLDEERRMIEKADHVVASSTGVKSHLETIGFQDVSLWENVAHVSVFTEAAKAIRKDQAVFAGNLTLTKIELQCLKSILDSGIELAIAGPIDIDGSGDTTQITELMNHSRVTYYGNLALPDLARLLGESKVGLIPYQINDYTGGVFPMKVYEYLAAGLSVVSTALPSLPIGIQNVSVVAPTAFGSQVDNQIATHDGAVAEQSIVAAKGHSWEARVQQANDLIDGRRHK